MNARAESARGRGNPLDPVVGALPLPRASGAFRRRAREYALALGAVVVATAACWWTRALFRQVDQALVYILVVLLVASRTSYLPSVFCSVAGVLAFDFLFVDPLFTLDVADPRFVVTFAVMLAVGLTVSRMTVRIRAHAEESAEARLAAETERTRSALLRTVSHDLRTPLASISGAADVLLSEGARLDEGAAREMLATVRDEAGRLGRLVEGLLDLTRLESGTFRPKREWCPLEEIVGSALGRVQEALRDRDVGVDLTGALLMVPVDAVLVEQVFVNLLENAAKYSPPGSPIEVRARPGPREVVVEVMDRGPGIPTGDEERIFEPFHRAAGGTAAPGTGLGLTVCRAVLRVHGGFIAAARREGGGTVFRFVLPVDGGPPPAEEEP
jgi:K+-sensing histidine kinase KdpD